MGASFADGYAAGLAAALREDVQDGTTPGMQTMMGGTTPGMQRMMGGTTGGMQTATRTRGSAARAHIPRTTSTTRRSAAVGTNMRPQLSTRVRGSVGRHIMRKLAARQRARDEDDDIDTHAANEMRFLQNVAKTAAARARQATMRHLALQEKAKLRKMYLEAKERLRRLDRNDHESAAVDVQEDVDMADMAVDVLSSPSPSLSPASRSPSPSTRRARPVWARGQGTSV
jgi:hypothetical protein